MSELLNKHGDQQSTIATTLKNFFAEKLRPDTTEPEYSDLYPFFRFISEGSISRFEKHPDDPYGNYWHIFRDDTPITTNDLKATKKEQAIVVVFSMGDFETLEAWNDGVYGSQTIYIDIFGKHNFEDSEGNDFRSNMEILRQLIDRILFQNYTVDKIGTHGETAMFNEETKISEFTGFLQNSIDWERIHENAEHGIVEQIAGELRVSTQRGFINS